MDLHIFFKSVMLNIKFRKKNLIIWLKLLLFLKESNNNSTWNTNWKITKKIIQKIWPKFKNNNVKDSKWNLSCENKWKTHVIFLSLKEIYLFCTKHIFVNISC